MRAGLLQYRITFLRPVLTETDYSANEPEYVPVGTVWARVQHKSGSLEISAEMLVNRPKVVFTVRDHIKVEYGMLVEADGVQYVILDIDSTTERGVLRITTEAKV